MNRDELWRVAVRLVERNAGTPREQMAYSRGVSDMLQVIWPCYATQMQARPCTRNAWPSPVDPRFTRRTDDVCTPPPRHYTYQIGATCAP